MPRTPEYDRSHVVDQAMAVFWERGYGKTSIGDLVAATGLKPGSLYAAFGSKKGIYLEVLEEYHRGFVVRIRDLARSGSPKMPAIRELLQTIADDAVSGRDRRGCLSVNALLEMSAHDPDIAARLDTHNAGVRLAFADLLRAAQQRGEISQDSDPMSLAAFLVSNIWGMRVMCKARADRAAMAAVVDGVIQSMGNGRG